MSITTGLVLMWSAGFVGGVCAETLVSRLRRQRFEMRRKYLEARLDRDIVFLEELLDDPGESSERSP